MCMRVILQSVVNCALHVETSCALGRPAFIFSHPVLPSPTPSPSTSAPAPLGSSRVAASYIVVKRSPATPDALIVNVVRDVGVHAEREARAVSGTPTSPSRIDHVAATVRRSVVVVAKAERKESVATTTLPPCVVHGVEAVGAAAEVEAAGESAAPTASRAPIPAHPAQEAAIPPQACRASSVNGGLSVAILLILLLLLLTWRILWEDAPAEAVKWQANARASMWVQAGSLVPTARGGEPRSWAAVPAAQHRSVRRTAGGCLQVPCVEARPDLVGRTQLGDPLCSSPAARGATGCDTTRGSGIIAPSGPVGPGGGESQAA